MTRDRWQRINDLFDAALEHADGERPGFLARACADDATLGREVQSLLDALEQAGSFMEEPPAAGTDELLDAGQLAVGQSVGPYRILKELGRGGMGVVYLAARADDAYSKLVAIKLVRPGPRYPEVLQRFRLERQILANLDHPNIARLLDGGTTGDGLPYVVMEHVAGEPLTDYCDRHGLPVTARLELFRTVCAAVQYAHQNLVIHRDLKPSNILVTEDGQVKLLDFGIAKLLKPELADGGASLTATGPHLMTPEYASPEQVRGGQMTTASDVYSLGVVLYELLTGHHPHRRRGGSLLGLGDAICEEEPERPSLAIADCGLRIAVSSEAKTGKPALGLRARLCSVIRSPQSAIRHQLRGDLDKIVLKALRKDPRQRYHSAEQLSEDVRRHLRGEAVIAQKTTLVYRAGKFARRHRLGLAVAAVFVLTLVGGAVAATWQAQVARRHARQNRWLLYAAQMNLAGQAWDTINLERVQELVENNRPGPGEEDLRGFEWFYLWRRLHRRSDYLAVRHDGEVWSVAFSPDGRRMASASEDRTAKVWDAADGRELLALRGHEKWVYAVSFSPDGRLLATASGDGTARLWDASTGAPLQTFRGHTRRVNAAVFSPDGRRLFTGSDDFSVKVWETATGREVATYRKPGAVLRCVAVSPDGGTLVASGGSGSTTLWDTATGRPLLSVEGHTDSVAAVKFAPDGRSFATAGYDHVTKVWETATGRELFTLRGHAARVTSVAFAPDGSTLATASDDRTVRLWEAATGRERAALRGHLRQVESVAFAPDGSRLVTGSIDQTVRLWRLAEEGEPDTLKGLGWYIRCLAYSPDGSLMALGRHDGAVIWDAARGRVLAHFRRGAHIFSVAFAPDGRSLALGDEFGSVVVYDMADGRELATMKAHADTVSGLVYAPDGRTLVTAGYDGTVKLFDAATYAEIKSVRAHDGRVFAVAFAPDGRTLATGGADHLVKLWDGSDGRELARLAGHDYWVNAVAFSPDGRLLASGAGDLTARLWDVSARAELLTLRGHSNNITSVAFSPEGTRLATGSLDATVRLWDVPTGQELISLRGHTDFVSSVAFSPDGRALASGGRDQSVRLWRAAGKDEAAAPPRE